MHARATVRLAVVGVIARNVELHDKGFALLAKLIINHRDTFLIDASRDAFLVEDYIVGSALVVDPMVK